MLLVASAFHLQKSQVSGHPAAEAAAPPHIAMMLALLFAAAFAVTWRASADPFMHPGAAIFDRVHLRP